MRGSSHVTGCKDDARRKAYSNQERGHAGRDRDVVQMRAVDSDVGQVSRGGSYSEDCQPVQSLISTSAPLICQRNDGENQCKHQKAAQVAQLEHIGYEITHVRSTDAGDHDANPIARPYGRDDLEVHVEPFSVLSRLARKHGRATKLDRQQRAPATLPQRCGIWIDTGVASEASGKRRVAVVPRPGVDVMISVPPWAAMIS